MAKEILPRQRQFALGLLEGHTQEEAYRRAGYKPHRSNACRLIANDSRVRKFIKERQREAMKRSDITTDTLLAQLEEARQNAKALKQPASEVSAIKLTAQLCGLLTDKHEVATKPVDKMNMEEVTAALKEAMGDELAEELLRAMKETQSKEKRERDQAHFLRTKDINGIPRETPQRNGTDRTKHTLHKRPTGGIHHHD
jgi:phage terminase small subunit